MENYNNDNFINAVNQISSSIKGKYEDLVAMLQQQKARVNQFVDPNSNLIKALNRRLKDVPDNDENAQTILQGLRHFRTLSQTIDKDIQVLQQADENDTSVDRSLFASVANTIDEIDANNRLINESLSKILNNPELNGIAKL